MQFEIIRKSHKKEIIIGISIFIILGVVLIARFTFAKYNLVKSIKIAEGTINYKVPDFKMIAMYKNDGNVDIEIETMPETGYAINEIKSYCTLDNINKDAKAKLYTDENGQHIISGLSKFSKCYLYFDKARDIRPEIIAQAKSTTPDFGKTAQKTCSGISDPCEETNGVYKAKDNDGDSYYFRGAVENNYVRFAGLWWRIIRINGDGTIRLIYDGTSARANGEVITDNIVPYAKWSHKDAYYNSITDNAYAIGGEYVGFQYTIGEIHGLGTKSNALQELEKWYTSYLLSYANKIDTNAGFCGDRTAHTYDSSDNYIEGGGTGTGWTDYGALTRAVSKAPVLTCTYANDLYTTNNSNKGSKSLTYPIGLISADEAAMAGGLFNIKNSSYYLNNGRAYRTMSPFRSNIELTSVCHVNGANGGYISSGIATMEEDILPVINLRTDTKFIGKGTISKPYIVE